MVGGGPVGLCVAAELAGAGVRVLVVEERGEVSLWPKATTLHARCVQCLVRRGFLGGLVSLEGVRTSAFHFAGLPGLAITAPEGEPEPVLKVEQVVLERHFEERARGAGARVVRGVRVTGVRQEHDGVRVFGVGEGGRFSWRALYVVGADGARSVVRELGGFGSRTYPATASAMMGRARLVDAGSLSGGWHRTRRGWLVVKPVGEGFVQLRTLNCRAPVGDRFRGVSAQELCREVSWIAGREVRLADVGWLSRFSDFSRVAQAYRVGRIFLAGDAAHVHFPIGGQGLSTGLLDAVNLAWKLVLRVRAGAHEGLLDSYDRERRPAAERVVDNTRAQLALMRPGSELDPLRTLIGNLLMAETEGGLGAMVSAQDTVLPQAAASAWEGRFFPNVALRTVQGVTDVIGLLRVSSRLVLLVLGEGGQGWARVAAGWPGAVRVVRAQALVPGVAGVGEALLLRPDGYVAWAAGGGEPLEAVLESLVGPGGEAVCGDAVSGDAVPGGAVFGGAVSGGAVSGRAASGDAVSGDAVPGGGAACGGAVSGGAVAGDAVPGSAVSGGVVSGGAVSGGAASAAAVSGSAVAGGPASGDAVSGGAVPGGVASGSAVSGGVASGGAVSGSAASGGALSGDAVPGGAVSGGAASGGAVASGAVSGGAVSGSAASAGAVFGGLVSGGAASGDGASGGAVPGDAVAGGGAVSGGGACGGVVSGGVVSGGVGVVSRSWPAGAGGGVPAVR
ncbi:FAD-dependent monooxygenase [Streptomyces sp. NPDC001904]|uniref:FAD-dependent monooxygenase n=1 Tax=Streptomyces sp. NPDC001904 TaxID=3154531 RepID=UPI003326AC3A